VAIRKGPGKLLRRRELEEHPFEGDVLSLRETRKGEGERSIISPQKKGAVGEEGRKPRNGLDSRTVTPRECT